MQNKVNYIYTIFNRDIVISNKVLINALQGYKVKKIAEVLSVKDIIDEFLTKLKISKIPSLPLDVFYEFENPLTKETWFIGKYLIAHSKNEQVPRIILVAVNSVIIVQNIQDYIAWKPILSDYYSILHLTVVNHSIGFLSTPHQVSINDSLSLYNVKLPYVI